MISSSRPFKNLGCDATLKSGHFKELKRNRLQNKFLVASFFINVFEYLIINVRKHSCFTNEMDKLNWKVWFKLKYWICKSIFINNFHQQGKNGINCAFPSSKRQDKHCFVLLFIPLCFSCKQPLWVTRFEKSKFLCTFFVYVEACLCAHCVRCYFGHTKITYMHECMQSVYYSSIYECT